MGPATRGQAIVPVIFIMMILTVLAVAFATSARREVRSASNFVTQTQQYYAARGAVNTAMAALAQTSNNGATYGIVPQAADTDANGWEQVGDVWVKIEVTDTGGLLNINNASLTTLQLMPLFQQNPDVAAAIVDWRTAGETPSANGAKSDYYTSLPTPYQCKDAPFDTVDELLLVKGITPTLLYGTTVAGTAVSPDVLNGTADANSTGAQPGLSRQATPGQTGGGTGTGGSGTSGTGSSTSEATAALAQQVYTGSTLPLAAMITTTTQERNVAVDGTPRININTASAQQLQQAGMSARLANRIVSYRGSSGTNGQTGGTTGGQGATGGANGGGATIGGGGMGGGARPGLQGGTTGVLGRPQSNPNGLSRAEGLSRQATLGGAARPGLQGATSATLGVGANRPGGASGGMNGGGTASGAGNASLSNGTGGANNSAFKSLGDLLNVSGFTSSVMASLADKLTTSSSAYNQNVVNINTAPQEVLATVPGMDTTILNAILSYRQGGKAFQSLDDLFALNTLSRPEMQAVIGSLCTKTSDYIVHVKVRAQGSQRVYAVSALVQITDYGPRLLQWREEPRTPGWANWVTPPTLPLPTPTTTGTTGTVQ